MSKEDKFHQWIEEQNQEEKAQAFERLKAELSLPDVQPMKKSKKPFSFWLKRLVPVCTAIIICIGIGTGIYLSSNQQAEKPEEPPQTPQDQTRYCAQSEYTKNEISMTLKEYSLQNGGNILYFDDYDVAEDLFDYSYSLNSTNEIIAFKEEYYNIDNGYLIFLSVTDNLTQMEEFTIHINKCSNETTINETTIKFHFLDTGYTTWEYNGYRYYLETIGPATLEETLALVEELLQK